MATRVKDFALRNFRPETLAAMAVDLQMAGDAWALKEVVGELKAMVGKEGREKMLGKAVADWIESKRDGGIPQTHDGAGF